MCPIFQDLGRLQCHYLLVDACSPSRHFPSVSEELRDNVSIPVPILAMAEEKTVFTLGGFMCSPAIQQCPHLGPQQAFLFSPHYWGILLPVVPPHPGPSPQCAGPSSSPSLWTTECQGPLASIISYCPAAVSGSHVTDIVCLGLILPLFTHVLRGLKQVIFFSFFFF